MTIRFKVKMPKFLEEMTTRFSEEMPKFKVEMTTGLKVTMPTTESTKKPMKVILLMNIKLISIKCASKIMTKM